MNTIIDERMNKIASRYGVLSTQLKHRDGRQALVLADLHAGKPAIVTRWFKWASGVEYGPGDEFLPKPEELGRVGILLRPGDYHLQTQQEAANAEEWKRLKGIVAKIESERATLQFYRQERSQATAELARAEKEVIYWRGELKTAESSLQTAEQRMSGFLDNAGA